MPVTVDLIGRAPGRPGPGAVTVNVRISGIDWCSESVLRPLFERLDDGVGWGWRHEPQFRIYFPLTFSVEEANRACNLFFGCHVQGTAGLQALVDWASVVPRFYGDCYYQCGVQFVGQDSAKPDDWKLVTCVGCKRKLGCACPNCSTKQRCVERCHPPCRQCQSLPPETPPSPGLD